MKVGDLVELSAHGKRLEMTCHRRGVVGLVEKIVSRVVSGGGVDVVYSILWSVDHKPRDAWRYYRRDIKHAKERPHGE